ncbi:MAG: MerR family transcriptional regulator, partial [Fusobacteriaceae bacterium]|nr:MerR family transcriptional regulator [Fusobacteriaceae bacterium]
MELLIGEMAKKCNLKITTLRYYEDLGLIKPMRNKENQRVYSESEIEWIQFIKRLKKINMPIKEIQKYSNLRDLGDKTIIERMNLLEEQKNKLIKEQEELQSSISYLNK